MIQSAFSSSTRWRKAARSVVAYPNPPSDFWMMSGCSMPSTHTTFAITPPGGNDSDNDDENDDESDGVVECPTIRAQLQPRPSPFVLTNYYGGGFASDDDRVALSSIRYASPTSANASCQGFYAAPSSKLVEEQKTRKMKTKKDKGGLAVSSKGEIGGDGLFESGGGGGGRDDDAVCIPLPPWAIRAGARETVYFDGRKVTVRFFFRS